MATPTPPRSAATSGVLLAPYLTEKSSVLAERNQYTFLVARTADKGSIARAVAARYGVRPTRVAVVRVPGKFVQYGRTVGHRSGVKKAIVTLPVGSTIPFGVKA